MKKVGICLLWLTALMGCMRESGLKKLQLASLDFKLAYCHIGSVFHITWGDRFGEKIIHVEVISPQDESEVRKQLPDEFQGFRVYIVSPIWHTGELVPELNRQMEEMMNQDYYRANPKGQWEATQFGRKIVEAEKSVWTSWSDKQKRDFIRSIILERRKKIPGYANCGDKFLTVD